MNESYIAAQGGALLFNKTSSSTLIRHAGKVRIKPHLLTLLVRVWCCNLC